MKVTGADDFAEATKWAQTKSKALGPKAGKTLAAILQAERESEEELRRQREQAERAALESMTDGVLHAIFLKMEQKRIRAIDLFRKIDKSADGSVSLDEFREGLEWMGSMPSDKEYQAIMGRLDKDGSGGVTLKEFDRAIKAVERKLVDPEAHAKLVSKRANDALKALKGDKVAEAACPACGYSSQEEGAIFCKKCGQRLPQSDTVRNLLGYTPQHIALPGPMDAADDIMLKIVARMNARKYRSVDFFRTMDRDASGIVSTEEFLTGLIKIGLDPDKEGFDFEVVVRHLDKDGSGDVSEKEFDKAAKLVVKKARHAGRHAELDTWGLKRRDDMASTFTCGLGSMRTTHESGSMTERSWRLASARTSSHHWSSASEGPRGHVGTLYQNASVQKQRVISTATSGAHPTSIKMPKLPLHKTLYKTAYFDGRFEKEPANVPHPSMLQKRERCTTATRNNLPPSMFGGIKQFHNTPVMKSSVDQAVFNRDMDFSGDDIFHPEFMALYEGSAGMPSSSRFKIQATQ